MEVSSSCDGKRIEHRVSRFDTLAGVAIKYGVEVADIKRMNGLVTDLQMFAHNKLQIPLPGRHPPSHCSSNGAYSNGHRSPPHRHHGDLLESFKSLRVKTPQRRISPAMSKLQGYYGLAPKLHSITEGTEMAVYRSTTLDLEAGTWQRPSLYSQPSLGHHRKSKSYANGFFPESEELKKDVLDDPWDHVEIDNYKNEKSVRRRQKMETEPHSRTPEILLRDENGGPFSGRSGKSLAPRPKSTRTDIDSARQIVTPFSESFVPNGNNSVRKSSSTSNLQESDSSLLWPIVKRASKADNISKPIFDSLPKPLTSRKNKAALD